MKKFLVIITLLIFPFTHSYSRQYDIDYFMECLESGSDQSVIHFFETHPKLITKTKHLIEFLELVRIKIEGRYGSSPSWDELYLQFQELSPRLAFKKETEREINSFLKTISSKTKSYELGSERVNPLSFDYRGEIDFDEEQKEPTIATTEAIVGALLMLIDTPYTRGAGAYLLTDAASKYKDY